MNYLQNNKRIGVMNTKAGAQKAVGASQRGFTIIESLVAISILVIAVLGPLIIVAQALRTSFFARDQMTAFFLAQEAIEYARNVRDKNSLTKADAADWLDGIVTSEATNPPVLAELDGTNKVRYNLIRGGAGYELQACPGNICPQINIDPDTGIYGEVAGSLKASPFTRQVVFYKSPGDASGTQEISMEVTMSWVQVGGTYEFKLRENLTNWKIQKYAN